MGKIDRTNYTRPNWIHCRFLRPEIDDKDIFRVTSIGSLYLVNVDLTLHAEPHEYCIEQIEDDTGEVSLGVVVCNMDGMATHEHMECMKKFNLYPTFLVVSCVGLVVTIVVYLFLPDLRTVPGKNLLALSSSLLLAFVLLLMELLYVDVENVSRGVCLFLGLNLL